LASHRKDFYNGITSQYAGGRYAKDVEKLVFDPVQPVTEIKASLTTRTRAERKVARAEMTKLSDRILSGFKTRHKYHQPRKETAEPWRQFLDGSTIEI
jgi:hypothetical protein